MNRIREAFDRLEQEGKRGFIPYITAGDPDLTTTAKLMIELAHAGATVIELGVPFSDPMADGPVIQRASERALRHGFGLQQVLDVAARTRAQSQVPIVLFSYYNPLLQFGFEKLMTEAQRAGIDGILVTDLTVEESPEFASALRANGLDMIFLVAPTSTDERLRMIAEQASGFIYAVSRAGVTGVRSEVSAAAERLVSRVRRFTKLPVAVGFGISTADQVADTWRYADAAVVGSAIVAEIEKRASAGDLVSQIGVFAGNLLAKTTN
jgi:tryptophan synthase alpha chain